MSEDFLSRWSRRKRSAAAEPEDTPEIPPEDAPEALATPGPVDPAGDAAVEPQSDAEILAALGLRHPDEMAPGDDFGAFLRARVPERLRRLALRRLWRSDPILANLDGLNHYDGDYTAKAAAGAPVRTLYEVGRGFARQAEAAVRALAEDEAEPAARPEPPAAPGPPASVRMPARATALAAAAPPAHAGDAPRGDSPRDASGDAKSDEGAEPGEPERPAAPARRMRFRFDEG